MKVSVNWLKQFMDIQLPVDQLVQRIGAQLGEVESVEYIGAKYKDVIVARVVTCDKHPNADKLSVCTIDDGGIVQNVERAENGYVTVVCGAPNVRTGMIVAWLPPGSVVPATFSKDPFVLEARDLRGVTSNGMLASASELAITEDHTGILEIDVEANPGTSFMDVYELDDYIIDIENKMFTHRPDCFGMLGVAREIAGISNVAFTSPDWYLKSLDRIKLGPERLPLYVRNEAGGLVPRLMAVAMAGVTVRPSPVIIQTYLSRVGLRPINNIVDVTNYLMLLTGQPLHAYDYDKIKAVSGEIPTLIARTAHEAEKLALLNSKTIELNDSSIVIATDKQAIGVAGVMGGAETEVDVSTKNIILEVANFDMYNIRRTSMRLGLFTDAVTRFNKGQSPLQNDIILEEAVATLQYVSGAQVASEVFDVKESLPATPTVTVNATFINQRLGLTATADDMAQRLRNVEFKVTVDGDELSVTAPYWRTDISIKEDVVEEVGRLIGYDHLPLGLPKRTIKPAAHNQLLNIKKTIRNRLASFGANELLTYSFVHGNLLERVGQDKSQSYKLSNALSPDIQYYRLSLLPSLLEKVHFNIKAGHNNFALFELNKSFNKTVADTDEPDLPGEQESLAFVYASQHNHAAAAYYQANLYATKLLQSLGVNYLVGPIEQEPTEAGMQQLLKPFELSRSAVVTVNGELIGVIGEFNQATRKNLKLPLTSSGFEFNIEKLARHARENSYVEAPKYPKVEQDICLKVDSQMSYQTLHDFVSAELAIFMHGRMLPSLTPLDIYQRADDPQFKQITFRFVVASYDKTMTAEEVNTMLDTVAGRANETFGATRI